MKGLWNWERLYVSPKIHFVHNVRLTNFVLHMSGEEVSNIPFKSPPRPKKQIAQHVYIILHQDKYFIVQRPSIGLLASLWEFSAINVKNLNADENTILLNLQKEYGVWAKLLKIGDELKHTYTHIKLTYMPILLMTQKKEINYEANYKDFSWQTIEGLNNFPIHNAHKKIIEWLREAKN